MNRVWHLSAGRLSDTLTEVFRDFPQLQGKCQGIRYKVGARHTSPPPGAAASTKRMRLSQSGPRTQTANQAKFIPPKISVVPPRR
jgi:hypothetical protein